MTPRPKDTPRPRRQQRAAEPPVPPPPGARWRYRPGVPTRAERADYRRRAARSATGFRVIEDGYARWLASGLPSTELHRFCDSDACVVVNRGTLARRAIAHGLAALPQDVRTAADVRGYRGRLGLASAPLDEALHARHRAEWARRDALPSATGRAG